MKTISDTETRHISIELGDGEYPALQAASGHWSITPDHVDVRFVVRAGQPETRRVEVSGATVDREPGDRARGLIPYTGTVDHTWPDVAKNALRHALSTMAGV